MKLTLKIKLLPTKIQADLLVKTIKEANTVCNAISEAAWETKVFNPFKIHNEVYHFLKGSANISAQVPLNIATPGRVVNHAGESDMYSCSVHYLVSKPIPSALAVGG